MADRSSSPAARLRIKAFLPADREVDPEYRGFLPWCEGPSAAQPVGLNFLRGFRDALAQPHPRAVVARLSQLDPAWRGFAFEGAGMGLALRDFLSPGPGWRWHSFNGLTGSRHLYLTTVGFGWALARTPRALWPNLAGLDPLTAPLALDGYGFHATWFDTERVFADRRVRFPARRWPDGPEHVESQLMQGVGRALWFVCGGSPREVAETIGSFAAPLRGSLWAGIGLAASYAGGVRAGLLLELADRAGDQLAWLRQGSAFALEARDRSDTQAAHTTSAARLLCAAEPSDILAVVQATRPSAGDAEAGVPGLYEQWRARLAGALAAAPKRQRPERAVEPADRLAVGSAVSR